MPPAIPYSWWPREPVVKHLRNELAYHRSNTKANTKAKPRLQSILVFAIPAVVLGVVLVTLWARFEKMFIFFPDSDVAYTPEMVGLEYQDVYFSTEDGHTLHGWYVPGSTDITWLWFHGNGGNIGHRVEEIGQINRRLGVNLFIFDYRGYGNSSGEPSEQGTYSDARAARQYLLSQTDAAPAKVIYFGRSLGAAVSLELAVEHPPAGLILVSPFSSLRDMARIAYPRLPLAGWLAGNRYNSLERIARVSSPSIIVHGEHDEVVPVAQGQKLHRAANEPKHFQLIPGAGHNDTYTAGGSIYWDSLTEFMDTLDR